MSSQVKELRLSIRSTVIKTLTGTERNWPIHEKRTELWVIVSCFRRWDSWLKGLPPTTNIYTDHQGLQYLNTKRRLNSRQASWYLELSVYDFIISDNIGQAKG